MHKIPSMLEYKSLTVARHAGGGRRCSIEDPDPNCPFGAKEVGQGPLLPVMPAVANAIYDAVGVRIDEMPITPDKVLQGAGAEGAGQDAARRARSTFPTCRIPSRSFVPPPWEGGDGNAVKDPAARGPAEGGAAS